VEYLTIIHNFWCSPKLSVKEFSSVLSLFGRIQKWLRNIIK